MSRNARLYRKKSRGSWVLCLLLPFSTWAQIPSKDTSPARELDIRRARVVIAHDRQATEAYQARAEIVRTLFNRALTNLTGKATPGAAWLSLGVSTQDVIGLKVFSAPGPNSGTRPAVVAAVLDGLLEAKMPPMNLIIWDKHRADLRRAGFFDLAVKYGVRAEGSAAAGYDEKTFYETALLGTLVWGDVEFGRKGEGVGRKSYVSKLITREMTKVINITPLLNHNSAGVSGNLYSLAIASVDNTFRFESDLTRLATAVPEIYALPVLGDRVVLNIVDALICQYEGEQRGLLHYSTALNELRLSTDPVALDILSLQELDGQRPNHAGLSSTNFVDLYQNASLLEIGVSDVTHIQIERIH